MAEWVRPVGGVLSGPQAGSVGILQPPNRLALGGSRHGPEPHIEPAQLLPPLPPELDAFVGREKEVADLILRLAEAPVVTIAGPGGAGKTRLMLHLARQLTEGGSFPDGVVFVELAPL